MSDNNDDLKRFINHTKRMLLETAFNEISKDMSKVRKESVSNRKSQVTIDDMICTIHKVKL